MRFHATLSHTPENCPGAPGRDGPPVTDWPARAKEVGIQLISAVQSQAAHTSFYVVETDDYTKLYDLFRPLQGFAKADIIPVRDLMDP